MTVCLPNSPSDESGPSARRHACTFVSKEKRLFLQRSKRMLGHVDNHDSTGRANIRKLYKPTNKAVALPSEQLGQGEAGPIALSSRADGHFRQSWFIRVCAVVRYDSGIQEHFGAVNTTLMTPVNATLPITSPADKRLKAMVWQCIQNCCTVSKKVNWHIQRIPHTMCKASIVRGVATAGKHATNKLIGHRMSTDKVSSHHFKGH